MDAVKTISFLGLVGGALAIPKFLVKENHTKINYPTDVGCGDVNIFYTSVEISCLVY